MRSLLLQRRGSGARVRRAGGGTDWSVGRVNVQTVYGGNLAAAAASGNSMLYVPPGTYTHSTAINFRNKDIVFENVTINGTVGVNSGLIFSGVSPRTRFVGNCFIDRPQWTTTDTYAVEGMGIVHGSYGWATTDALFIADNLVLNRIWGAAFFVHDTAGAVIQGNIHNIGSGRDSFHVTGGSTDIDFQAHIRATDSGDDGAAVVSYGGEAQCQRIRYRHVIIDGIQLWGRGVTVVGGKDIQIDYADIQNTAGAGIYIACEGSYDTWGVDNVTIVNAKVRTPNLKGIHANNVQIFSDVAGRIVTNVNVVCDPDSGYPLWGKTGAQPATNLNVISTLTQVNSPSSLQAAITAAPVGATLALKGTFNEDVRVTKRLSFIVQTGEVATVNGRWWFDSNASGSVVNGDRLVHNGANAGNLPSPTFNCRVHWTGGEVTNGNTAIGFDVNNYGGGIPDGTVIEEVWIHNCGGMPPGNHDHGIYIGNGNNIVIRNNVVHDCADRGIQIYSDVHNSQIYNNLVAYCGQGIILGGGEWGTPSSYCTFTKNIVAFAQTDRGGYEEWWNYGPTGPGNSFNDNVLWDPPDHRQDTPFTFPVTNVQIVDPQFTNGAARNFKLLPGSLAAGYGPRSIQ